MSRQADKTEVEQERLAGQCGALKLQLAEESAKAQLEASAAAAAAAASAEQAAELRAHNDRLTEQNIQLEVGFDVLAGLQRRYIDVLVRTQMFQQPAATASCVSANSRPHYSREFRTILISSNRAAGCAEGAPELGCDHSGTRRGGPRDGRAPATAGCRGGGGAGRGARGATTLPRGACRPPDRRPC